MNKAENVSSNELKSLTERVTNLLDIEIDHLWYSCGWRTEDPEEGFKVLRCEDLRQFRAGFNSAKEKVKELLFVVPLITFKRKLIRAESGIDIIH